MRTKPFGALFAAPQEEVRPRPLHMQHLFCAAHSGRGRAETNWNANLGYL